MDPEFFRIAAAVVALGGGLIVILIVLRSKGRKRAEQLGPAFELGTSRPAGVLDSAVEGLYRGYSCRYLIQYASQYDRGGGALRFAVISPQRWTAEVSNTGSRLLARLGLLKDFEIGDQELDQHLRFAADDEGVLRSLFGSGTVLGAMRLLAASENFESCQVRPDRVDVRWSPRVPMLDENPDVLRTRLEVVASLIVACGYPPKLAP